MLILVLLPILVLWHRSRIEILEEDIVAEELEDENLIVMEDSVEENNVESESECFLCLKNEFFNFRTKNIYATIVINNQLYTEEFSSAFCTVLHWLDKHDLFIQIPNRQVFTSSIRQGSKEVVVETFDVVGILDVISYTVDEIIKIIKIDEYSHDIILTAILFIITQSRQFAKNKLIDIADLLIKDKEYKHLISKNLDAMQSNKDDLKFIEIAYEKALDHIIPTPHSEVKGTVMEMPSVPNFIYKN